MKKSVLAGFGALAIAALLLAPVCALAAEWNMYGSARMKFFYTNFSKEVTDNYYIVHTGDGVNDDTELDFGVVGNSRIGANVKVSDVVSGRFEYGTGVNTRLLYGDWHFGAGTLRFGQDYTPISGATSNQVFAVDDNLNSVGAVDGPRSGQIKLIMGGLQVALADNQGSSTFAGYTAEDKVFPKIEASYEFATDTLSIMPFAGYQVFDAERTGASHETKSVSSYLVGVHGRVNLGPAYVNFSGHINQNGADYGLFNLNEHGVGNAQLVGDSVKDSTGYGCALVAGFKPSDTLQLEAGIGYVYSEVDLPTSRKAKDDTIAYYVNAVITLAPGVYVVPEIGMYDFGKYKESGVADEKEGDLLYYGAKFQIDF